MQGMSHFAKTDFRNQERSVGIKTDDRRRHMYVMEDRYGKTNLLENLVIQGHSEGARGHLHRSSWRYGGKTHQRFPNRINDIYFNPVRSDFPIAFNVMEKVGPEYRHLVASGLVGVFKDLGPVRGSPVGIHSSGIPLQSPS